MRSILAALTLALSASFAIAQVNIPGQPFVLPATVGLTSSVVAPVNLARKKIMFVNPNPVAKIAVCPSVSRVGPNPAPINCAIGGAGSIVLLPYGSFQIDQTGSSAVATSWNGISDTAAQALTIFEFE